GRVSVIGFHNLILVCDEVGSGERRRTAWPKLRQTAAACVTTLSMVCKTWTRFREASREYILGAMPVVISLLRGVNLASHNRVKMEALRALYEKLGLENPQTYVQSGNVIFQTEERNLSTIANRIEQAIEKNFGFRAPVIVRT